MKNKVRSVNELKDIDKGKIPAEKQFSLKNAALFCSAREKILNKFKSKIFP